MGNQPSASGTISSLNQTQLEETQNSLLNRYQFNQINGKLKLNGTEVHPEEIRDLLSNKNAQRVIMQKAFENGWENISQELEQDEKYIQNINHLAPFEGSCANIGSENEMTLKHMQIESGYIKSLGPMKNQQFIQHMQKQGENINEESIQQSSVQEGTKYSQQINSKASSQHMNRIFNIKNDSKNGSISFGPTGIFKNGFSRNLSQRSNQSDSIMQFNCEELSARNNVINNNLSNGQTSRRHGFQQSGNQILTNIKETEDSVEKDYSNYQDIDVIIPEINFQNSENRIEFQNKNGGLQNQQEKHNNFNICNSNNSRQQNYQLSVQFDNEQNNYESNNTQQLHVENLSQNYNSIVPNNSSIYQYQAGINEGQAAEVPKKYVSLEQLIRSRKNSKQISDGLLSANAQESICAQSPLNVELVRNFIALNESQMSNNQADLNPRQLEILRELIKEDHILKTIHKTLQSQQNTSREMQNQPQSKIKLTCRQGQENLNNLEEQQQTSFNVVKQLQQAFESEANENAQNYMDQVEQGENIQSQNDHLNIYENYEQLDPKSNSSTFNNFKQNVQNSQMRQNKFQNPSFVQDQNNTQNSMLRQAQNSNKLQNISATNENICIKQKPNIQMDQNVRSDYPKESFSNRINDASSLKGPIVYTEQLESCDNISQCYIEGYSYRTNNSFKSIEQKKRSISQNTFGNNQLNNRSTSSFYQVNDDKQQNSDFQNINNIYTNGQITGSNLQQSLNNSINLQGIQYKICSSVNNENVKNPIKKIRSFSSNSRSNQQSQNQLLQDSINPNNLNEQSSNNNNNNVFLNNSQDTFKNSNMQKANVFQTFTQINDQQNTIKPTSQIKFNQLNILSSQLQSTKNQSSQNNIPNQFNPLSNKSGKEQSNYFLNYNNSMNNSFNCALNSSYGDCQNVNQSFEKKFRKLRSVSHQDNNRNSFVNSSNNIQSYQVQSSNNQINEDSQQQYQSLLNAIPTINTQVQMNTNSSFQINQVHLTTHPAEEINQKQNTQEASINLKNQRQIIQPGAYESVCSQKSSGFKALNCKENYESHSNRNKQNQIISFNSSNKMRFMTIQEQTENSNYPSMYSVQMQQQQNQQIQTQFTRQSLVSQQERQSKIICSEAEKDSCIYSDLKSQQTMNSQQKPEIKNISCINQNMRKNNTYFNSNVQNDEELKLNQDYEFNKYFCKNVQSISNTPISKGIIESSSSRFVSRSALQQQNKENEQEEIQSMSSLIRLSQNAQSLTKNFSHSNIQQSGAGKTECLPPSFSSKALLKRENSSKVINQKVLNESHIQYTSKKQQQGALSSINASYIYSPSKQISVNILQNDQSENNINTPNQSCLSRNAALCLFGDRQQPSNDNSLLVNQAPPVNRSSSTECRASGLTNNHEVRKTITGIKKFRSSSNNNSFITNQSDQNFQINNESDQQVSLNNSKMQLNNQNSVTINQLIQEEEQQQILLKQQKQIIQNKKMGEKHEISIQNLKENTDNFTNNDFKQRDSLQYGHKTSQTQHNTGCLKTESSNFQNTFQNIEGNENNNLRESTIYQRNKFLIEQIKQSNQDIFESDFNLSQQKEQQFDHEIVCSEQKFNNCNQQTTQKEIIESDCQLQSEVILRKQSSQLSQREKSLNQYSDNKYKRNDLKLNDSIDFNKNQNENDDKEYYDMKILNLQQNTKLTNESQEKIKEMMKKMKEAQQNNQQQQSSMGKQQDSCQDQKLLSSQKKDENKKTQNTQANQIFINSTTNQSFENQKMQNQNKFIQFDNTQSDNQQNQSQFEIVSNYENQNRQIFNSNLKQKNDQLQGKISDQKLKNLNHNKTTEENNKTFNQNQQSQAFYLDTFKQQYFEQGDDEEQEIEFEEDNLNNFQQQQESGTATCLTETSRKDNQCLDEISQQLQYLKQRSRNMDYSIQSEINVLEEKVAKIFTKIKFEKLSKSKENSFVGSVNQQNNSTNIILNQIPISNISSIQNIQNNQRKIASYTTASNSNTSSKFLSQQQYQNISQSQQHIASYLGLNLQSYDNNCELNDLQNDDQDRDIFNQDSLTPVDQPLALEQPESQFSALSIETLGQTSKSKGINDNKISRSLLNYNTSNNYNQDSLKRYAQQNSQFNNNQSMFNQIEEPYEAQEETNSNFYILSGSKQSNQQNLKTEGQNEHGNFFKNNTKYVCNNLIKMNDIQIKQEFQKSQEISNSNQQFSDYFEQQVNKNNQMNKDQQLNQQESFYSSISNRFILNSATNRSQLQGNHNSIKRQESNFQMISNGPLCSSSSNRSNTKINTLSYINSSNQGERQKKDLELLKIMHILEENPNNVISSIKQFETLDSQQMQNELAQQQHQQSQYDFEQLHSANHYINNQEKTSKENEQKIQFDQFQNIKQQAYLAQNQYQLNQNQHNQENYQAHFFKNQYNIQPQAPLFEMSIQEWQNASASFPNNSTKNNSSLQNQHSNIQKFNQENSLKYEKQYDQIDQQSSLDRHNDEVNSLEQFVSKQIIQNRAKNVKQVNSVSTKRSLFNDVSDKENKIPEQKVNLIELLQKKQQQQQLNQQSQQKKTLLALQEQNINIQLDFNTPIISTKSNQNQYSKFKNDQIDDENQFNTIQYEQFGQNQIQFSRRNHHLGYQKIHERNSKLTPDKCMSSQNMSANTSKSNTSKKILNSKSSQKILSQNPSSQIFLDYQNQVDEQKNQRQKTHEKITQLYKQHQNFILKQEKINQELDVNNSSSSINYWKIRNAESRKRSRNSSNSGPRSTGKDKNNGQQIEKEKIPKNQLSEIVTFLNEQQRMNKPIFDIIKQNNAHQFEIKKNQLKNN
ncbi:endo-1,4-beta-xylanase xylA, putative (macronuclear) [Tetrahymena thermophila SB210]|uniref:Endo-1,4-beta-xylanase xylA, putative n=1 Tax=Tetrahymena thermophila (strain SB210) TaxID=312017 RepID=I7MCP0_TETTS|nr:endo-1,4-beta-xylanase xylA, putative [Tetrahymena thermophila SB210]EAR84459.2 endo-1,4-beta-xylanase xylA, putative [Tetrahymena thermophila SB210]|eukprot:XP_001032122.2 endo-1,4-beta-xylanase xylA, putative [Tetrahymena thermophila SB210]